MNIVSSSFFLRNLRNLDFFKLDLGKTKKLVGKDEYRKLDEFVLKYRNLYGREIMKFGLIGDRIIFYEDLNLKNNEYIIFNNEDIYEITYTNDDLLDVKNYILETLRKIDEYDSEEKEKIQKNEKVLMNHVNETGGWMSSDVKNGKKTYTIDQKLSREEYRKQMAELLKKRSE